MCTHAFNRTYTRYSYTCTDAEYTLAPVGLEGQDVEFAIGVEADDNLEQAPVCVRGRVAVGMGVCVQVTLKQKQNVEAPSA